LTAPSKNPARSAQKNTSPNPHFHEVSTLGLPHLPLPCSHTLETYAKPAALLSYSWWNRASRPPQTALSAKYGGPAPSPGRATEPLWCILGQPGRGLGGVGDCRRLLREADFNTDSHQTVSGAPSHRCAPQFPIKCWGALKGGVRGGGMTLLADQLVKQGNQKKGKV